MAEQNEPKFTSPETQHEILKEMSSSVLHDIVEFIKNADFYSIMVDETLDVSNKEMVFFCVCWLDKNLFSYEHFLGLHEMEKSNTIIIVSYFIKDIILRLDFGSKKLRGYSRGGCATMVGCYADKK